MTTRQSRRIGLTKSSFAGPSLHSSINGFRRSDKLNKDQHVQSNSNAPAAIADNDENIYACPRSSDTEDDKNEEVKDDGAPPEEKASSGSEDELGSLITKGNLKKTTFKTGTRHQTARVSSSQPHRGVEHTSQGETIATRESKERTAVGHGRPSSSIKSNPSNSQTADWLLQSSQSGRSKRRTVYGSSQRSDRNKPASSSQNKEQSPKKTFKIPDISVDDDYPTSPEKRLRIASSPSDDSSPVRSSTSEHPASKKRRSAPGSPALLVEKGFIVPSFESEDDEDRPFIKPNLQTLSGSFENSLPASAKHPPLGSKSKKKRAVKEKEDTDSQMRAPFHMDSFVEELLTADDPDDLPGDWGCYVDSKTSREDKISDIGGSLYEDVVERTKIASMKCPMCGQLVDKSFYDVFSQGKKLSVTSQTRFHHAHLRQAAKKEHAARGFPEIDWPKLTSRLHNHRDLVSSILSGRLQSHYRDALSAHIASGKSRTLRQGIFAGAAADPTEKATDSIANVESVVQSLIPGYYGSRGLRAISEWVMDQFSDELRKMSVRDRIVGKRGVTEYVQTVLVRELVCKLIMEDMSVSLEEARILLLSSAEMGELVNEEIVEVVERTDDSLDWT